MERDVWKTTCTRHSSEYPADHHLKEKEIIIQFYQLTWKSILATNLRAQKNFSTVAGHLDQLNKFDLSKVLKIFISK